MSETYLGLSLPWLIWPIMSVVWYYAGKLRGRRQAREAIELENQLRRRAGDGPTAPLYSVAFSSAAPGPNAPARYPTWLTPNGTYRREFVDRGVIGSEMEYRHTSPDILAAYRHDDHLFVAQIIPGGPSLTALGEIRGIGGGWLQNMSVAAYDEVMALDRQALFRLLCALNVLPGFIEYMERNGIDVVDFFNSQHVSPAVAEAAQFTAPRRHLDLDD